MINGGGGELFWYQSATHYWFFFFGDLSNLLVHQEDSLWLKIWDHSSRQPPHRYNPPIVTLQGDFLKCEYEHEYEHEK